jgi:hypothetical protein
MLLCMLRMQGFKMSNLKMQYFYRELESGMDGTLHSEAKIWKE